MHRLFISTCCSVFCAGILLLLPACGNKPDGTPYGVDPSKLPAARLAKANSSRPTPPATDVPKGAELNAVTSGASAGQPQVAAKPTLLPTTTSR
ncbi:MAG: hypothetical protein ACRYG7_40395 [Janthinobacterium lividum]